MMQDSGDRASPDNSPLNNNKELDENIMSNIPLFFCPTIFITPSPDLKLRGKYVKLPALSSPSTFIVLLIGHQLERV